MSDSQLPYQPVTPKISNTSLANIRTEYQGNPLSPNTCYSDPLKQLEKWLTEAINAMEKEPTAMNLATVASSGMPSCRIVLLKEIDQGLIFYTNYRSKKAEDLSNQPLACLNFFWPNLHRQIRISGKIEKTSRAVSEDYFNSRPTGSRKSAAGSPQSQVIEDEAELKKLLDSIDDMPETKLQCPEWWGGYRLIPAAFEFWQGRPNRFHDRVLYSPAPETASVDNNSPEFKNLKWRKSRLAP